MASTLKLFTCIFLFLFFGISHAGFSKMSGSSDWMNYRIEGFHLTKPDAANIPFSITIEASSYLAAKKKAQDFFKSIKKNTTAIGKITSYGTSKRNAHGYVVFGNKDESRISIKFESHLTVPLKIKDDYWTRIDKIARAFDAIREPYKKYKEDDAISFDVGNPNYFVSDIQQFRKVLSAKILEQSKTTQEDFTPSKIGKIEITKFECNGDLNQNSPNVMQTELSMKCEIAFGLSKKKTP